MPVRLVGCLLGCLLACLLGWVGGLVGWLVGCLLGEYIRSLVVLLFAGTVGKPLRIWCRILSVCALAEQSRASLIPAL